MAEPSHSLSDVLSELDSLLRLHNLASRAVRRQDDNDPYFQILLRLHYTTDGRLSQSELSDCLQLTTSQVQKITIPMQSAGALRRGEGAPRGGVFIEITEAGRQQVRSYLFERARGFNLIQQLLGGHGAGLASNPTVTKLLRELRGSVTRRSASLRVAG